VIISINDFLQSGKLAPLTFEMSKEAVRQHLGNPEAISIQKHPEIWGYPIKELNAVLELSFYRGPDGSDPLLASMTIYFKKNFLPVSSSPIRIAEATFTPKRELSFQEFLAHLQASKIPCIGGVASGPHRHLVLASGVRATFEGYDLRLMSWGDGAEVPNSGISLLIVGVDNNDLLHIRVFDANSDRITDTDETDLPNTQAGAISRLKQQLPRLLPPHVLTDAEKAQVYDEATLIVGQTLNEGSLWSLGVTHQSESKTKQISISVPKEYYETIAREAKSRGITISALCASWILEHSAPHRSAPV
jgi:hypothetical protein